MAPGTLSLTGDWFRGNDSKQNLYYNPSYGNSRFNLASIVQSISEVSEINVYINNGPGEGADNPLGSFLKKMYLLSI